MTPAPNDTEPQDTTPPAFEPPAAASSTDTTTATNTDQDDHLHRGGPGRMLAGVAAGLGEYFDVDPTLVRVGFVVLGLMGGLAIPLYLAGWLLIPDEGADQSVAEELIGRERARSN